MVLLIKDEYPEKLFREDGKRLDGRDKKELRPIKMQVGILKNADGSAYIEWGNNKIFAAVFGPREVHPHHLSKPDRGILRVFYRMATYSVFERKRPAPSRREKEISMIIADCLEPVLFLELYPGTAFEIFIEVIDADGGTRCASTIVASLASTSGMVLKSSQKTSKRSLFLIWISNLAIFIFCSPMPCNSICISFTLSCIEI